MRFDCSTPRTTRQRACLGIEQIRGLARAVFIARATAGLDPWNTARSAERETRQFQGTAGWRSR